MHRLALLILLLGIQFAAHAQIEVGLDMKRSLFMRGEPIEATVTVRNLAGKDIMLADDGQSRWFGFQIMKGNDTPIGAYSGDYRNAPQMMLSGGSMKRTVDLVKLYPVNEYGS